VSKVVIPKLGLQQWVETFVCVIAWGGCATAS